MATLIHPDDTGTLDRAAVEEAANRAEVEQSSTVSLEALDQHARELKAWLDTHGTLTEDEGRAGDDAPRAADLHAAFPAGVPPILVHQHVWPATPEAFHPTTAGSADLDALIDRALAPVGSSSSTSVLEPARFTATGSLASHDEPDERQHARRRGLGWATMIALWAIAAAITVPLAISSIVGAFDMTIDLSGNGEVAAEEAPADVDGSNETDTELAGG